MYHDAPHYGMAQQETGSASSSDIINGIRSLDDLEAAVNQLENTPSLHQDDHKTLIKPLIRLCKDSSEQEKEFCALLGERILLSCISRLPDNLEERYKDDSTLLQLDLDDYNTILLLCGTQRSERGAEQAEGLMRLMESEYKEELKFRSGQITRPVVPLTPTAPKPSMVTYKYVLRAWALSGTLDGAIQAGRILNLMEIMSGMGENASDLIITIDQPDTQCYNALLSAYAKFQPNEDFHVFDHAKALLDRIKSIRPDNFEDQQWFSYHSILKCYENQINSLKSNDPTLSVELESLLSECMLSKIPDSFHQKFARESRFMESWVYGILVKSYLQENTDEENIRRAHSLVLAMAGFDSPQNWLQIDPNNNWPDQKTLIDVWKAWDQSQAVDKQERLDQLRGIIIQTKYHRSRAMNFALELWNDSEIPESHVIVYQILENCLSNIEFERFKEKVPIDLLRPNQKSFELVMIAWLNSPAPEAPQRLESLLRLMIQLHKLTGFKRYLPVDRHYLFVIQSWLRHCGDGEKHKGANGFLLAAQHINTHLETFPLNYRHFPVVNRNIAACFQAALDAWASQELLEDTDDVDRLENAVSWLNRLQQLLNGSPPAPHCNAVLKCCSRWNQTRDRRKQAYEVAMNIYHRGSRNASTFALVVQVMKSTLGDGMSVTHMRFLQDIFEEAKNESFVSQQLVWELVEVATEERILQNMFGLSNDTAQEIIEAKHEALCRTKDGQLEWISNTPEELLVTNMPRSWQSRFGT